MDTPPQRSVAARVYTNAGWLVGTFHVPEAASFDAFLDAAGPYFNLTQVTLPAGPATLEFFAVRKDAIVLIVPQVEITELKLGPAESTATTHEVACLLESGIILGKLDVAEGVRVSDYLVSHKGFTDLHACQWVSGAPKVEAPIAFVNSPRVIGITERNA